MVLPKCLAAMAEALDMPAGPAADPRTVSQIASSGSPAWRISRAAKNRRVRGLSVSISGPARRLHSPGLRPIACHSSASKLTRNQTPCAAGHGVFCRTSFSDDLDHFRTCPCRPRLDRRRRDVQPATMSSSVDFREALCAIASMAARPRDARSACLQCRFDVAGVTRSPGAHTRLLRTRAAHRTYRWRAIPDMGH